MKKRKFSENGMMFWICLILGLVLLIWPDLSTRLICFVLGAILAAVGIVRIALYFIRDSYLGLLRQDLTVGLLCLGGGGFLLFWPQMVASFLPVLFGLLLLVAGADRLQAGMDLRRMGSNYWLGTIIAALVTLILGAVVLANPFDTALLLIRFIGVSLVVVGCAGLGTSMLVSRMVRDFYADRFGDPGPIEVEAVDVTDKEQNR